MINVPEQFAVWDAALDGYPLIININVGLRNYSQKKAIPWFLSISTPLHFATDKGLPTRQEADELNVWESELNREIGVVPFIYVGRVTWKGNRELLYYVKSPESPVHRLQALIDSHSTRPFAFRCEKDDGWAIVSMYFR